MAVRSSGGWAFAPARPHQREGRSHPFCISPLLCLINWVPNTPVEYVMCPSQQRPLPTWTPPPSPPPTPFLPSTCLPTSLLSCSSYHPPHPPFLSVSATLSSSQTLSHSHSSLPLSISVCAGNLQNTLAYTWYSRQAKGGGGGGGWEKKMKKYEKQFNNNNDADDKINYAQGWRMRKKRRRPRQQSLT